jgi:hypothetical protein
MHSYDSKICAMDYPGASIVLNSTHTFQSTGGRRRARRCFIRLSSKMFLGAQ